jgi:hypothetical protein
MRAPHDRVLVWGIRLDHRIHCAYARARLAEALHDVALDAIDPSPLVSEREREWLRHALERPIRVATEAAIGTLVAELEQVLVAHLEAVAPEVADAPPSVLTRPHDA